MMKTKATENNDKYFWDDDFVITKTFGNDFCSGNISTSDYKELVDNRNHYRSQGYKVIGRKVYIPAGTYLYDNADDIQQIKLKDEWIPIYIPDSI